MDGTANKVVPSKNEEVMQMNSIKFNSDFIENLIAESNRNMPEIFECSEQLSRAVNSLSECKGFCIEEAQEAILDEKLRIKQIYEKMLYFKEASEKAAFIYANAENSIKRSITELPVLTHGNICSIADAHSVFREAVVSDYDGIIKSASASKLLKSNTVMHEDWLLALTAKKIMD